MKFIIHTSKLRVVVTIFILVLALASHQVARAQDPVFTTLHNFNSYADGANNDTQMTLSSDGILYGVTEGGGTAGDGTIFALNNGVYTTLYSFTGNPDGKDPVAGLVLASDGKLYGTTDSGGANSYGVLFSITIGSNTPHTYVYEKLFDFTGTTGEFPEGSLMQATDGYVYGTATSGGADNDGSIWRFKPGAAPTVSLYYSFTDGSTNSDGSDPAAGVIEASDHFLYGTTYDGGTSGDGTIYQINLTSGSPTLTTTHNFVGSDGIRPAHGGLVQASDDNIYGTALTGGANGDGSVFLIGMGTAPPYKTLFSFGTSAFPGAYPESRLVSASDGRLYGTTYSGGSHGDGTIFAITLGTSSAFSSVYSFANTSDGYTPYGSLAVGPDGQLYGASYYGGITSNGSTSRSLGVLYKISGTTPFEFTKVFSYDDGFIDGYNNYSKLTIGPDKDFWGITPKGGSQNDGTIFKVSPAGVETVIHSFHDGTVTEDGIGPTYGLLLATDGNFYGTTTGGGTAAAGTLFKVTPAGAVSIFYNFPGTAAKVPEGVLIQGKAADTNLYGTTSQGGSSGVGTIFKISMSGNVTYLHNFSGGVDGEGPNGALVLGSDGFLYGTTTGGGENDTTETDDNGTFFRISTDGTVYNVYAFDGTNGYQPYGALVEVSPLTFWGTTESASKDSSAQGGNVFKATSTGAITSVFSLNGAAGYRPISGLLESSDGDLYGTASSGGFDSYGTIYKYDPQTNLLSPLHVFESLHGANPEGMLIQGTDGNIYGTTYSGGSNGDGAVFSINDYIPYITGFSATNVGEGATITVNGAHFTGATGVKFGTTSTTFTVLKDNQVNVVVPIGATSQTISVTTPHGTCSHSGLTFKTTPAAAVNIIAPASAAVGQIVLLTGQYFTGTTKVAFGGADGASATYVVNSDTQLTAVVPAGATTGVIVVFTPSGPGDSLATFSVQTSATPTITTFTPTTGPVGTLVQISGSNFTSVSSVKFHGTPASFTVSNENSLVGLVPTAATNGTITVTTNAGTATSSALYTVATPTVSLTSFSPMSGPVGTLVVLTGTGFTGATQVTFNGVAAGFTVNSDTSITATVPTGATTGKIAITTASGIATSTASFTVN